MTDKNVVLEIWRIGDSAAWRVWLSLEEAQAALEEIRDSKLNDADSFFEVYGGAKLDEDEDLHPYSLIVKFDVIDAACIWQPKEK